MVKKLSTRDLQRAKIGDLLPDGEVPGLQVRKGKRGVSWRVKVKGKWKPVGKGLGIEAAREKARQFLGTGDGGDITMKGLMEHWLLTCGRRNLEEPRRVWEKRILPWFGEDTLAAGLMRRDFAAWTQSLRNEGLSVAAVNRYWGILRAAYRTAVRDGRLATDEPIRLVRAGGKEEEGTRVYTDDEIRTLWNLPDTAGRAMRFVLLTGLRSHAAIAMEWAWVDRQAHLARIPGIAMKTGKGFLLPLSEAALEVLGDAKGDYCFPGVGKTGHLGETAIPQAVVRALGTGVEVRTSRRTIASWLEEQGTPMQVIQAVLAHKPSTIAGRHYISDEARLKAHREALEAWQGHLLEVTSEDE